MFIQLIYDIICHINNFLHLITDWMLDIPVLKYLGIGLNWIFDGFKAIEYHLLFNDIINLHRNPEVYSSLHYKVNYGFHFFFALLTAVIIYFLVMFLIARVIGTIQDKVESRKIRTLEGELNKKLKAIGSTAEYRCRYKDWKYVISYDESPFEEACKYMRKTIAEIEHFIASGGEGRELAVDDGRSGWRKQEE